MIFRVSALARARGATFARRWASSGVSTQKPSSGGLNAFVAGWYKLFGASTARYATFLTVGVIGVELATNSVTDSLWDMNNHGRTYGQIDWSKFDPTDDEEEEDDDDDDDDDE